MGPEAPCTPPPIETQLATPLPPTSTSSPSAAAASSSEPQGNEYIEIVDSCGPYFNGECVNLREGPGTGYPVVMKLRNSMVLKVASTTIADGHLWYQIGFDTEIKFPERVQGQWWVRGEYVRPFYDPGTILGRKINATSTKRIVVSISTQELFAYDGSTLFLHAPVSTGLNDTPTPLGHFWVMRKVPDAYMQGPIPGVTDQYYDLPGVPWDLYFTAEGAAIHGAYWHDHFGQQWSHGCVNLPPNVAHELYDWTPVGTPIIVQK